MITLSVVIPTYNRRDSLQITLDALARQTLPFDRWEVVVVSDGSTDGTGAFLDEYARTVPFRLRTITQENAGPSRARNRGLREATGEIIVFLDDDVEPVPDFLASHAAHHADSSVAACVIGPMKRDPARTEPCWIAWEHQMLQKQYDKFESGEWSSPGPNNFYSGNASVRRDHLLKVGGFDEKFTRQEDVELAHRLDANLGLVWRYDAACHGIHRPLRTFPGWERVPFAYGSLDVERARSGNASFEDVRKWYAGRNSVTRAAARLALAAPSVSVPLRASLLAAAKTLYAMRVTGPALSALSVLYNIRYLEGAQDAFGGDKAGLRRLLWARTDEEISLPSTR